METTSEKKRYMAPIDRFWEMTRHLYDAKIQGRSEKIAFAAGMGLLATGTGFFPALAGVAVTMVVASTALGLFDSFKRGHGKITEEMLQEAYANLIEPTSSASADKKAHSYLNFQEMIDRFSQSNTITYGHLEMMVAFYARANAALKHETLPYAGTPAPFGGHLYGTPLCASVVISDRRVKEWAPAVATRCYDSAMLGRLSNNLSESIENLRWLKMARLALDLVKTGGDPVEYREQQARKKHLLEKVIALKNEHKNGVSLDSFRLDENNEFTRTEWLPSIAANTLYQGIAHEIEMFTPKPSVTESYKLWKPKRDEIAAAVLNAKDGIHVQWVNGVRSETTPDGELKTSEGILAGHTKLYDVLRHAYKKPREAPSDLASLEIINDCPANIKHSLQYVEISDPVHKELTQLGVLAENFRKDTLSVIADRLYDDLSEINLWNRRSDDFLEFTETLARYSVLCDHLDLQYQLRTVQNSLSDLSTRLKEIKITGLDPETLGGWTVKRYEQLLKDIEPVVDQVLNRLNVNIAAREERQNAELATESPAPGSMNN